MDLVWFRKRRRPITSAAAWNADGLAAVAQDEPESPREWTHFLEFDDEQQARAAASRLRMMWRIDDISPLPDGTWQVSISQPGVRVTGPLLEETQRGLRQFLAALKHGHYAGWQPRPAHVVSRVPT